MAKAGVWPVTYPDSCELTIAVLYLSGMADDDGWGSLVRREVEEWVARESAADGWLAANPPVIEWWTNGVMPLEIDPSEPIVGTMAQATEDLLGRSTRAERPGLLV